MDVITRTFTVCAISGKYRVKLTMTFPEAYPHNAPPTFQIGEGTNLEKQHQSKLMKVCCVLKKCFTYIL